MSICPTHMENLVKPANELFPEDHDAYHHFFQVVCLCDGDKFALVQSDKRSLLATCQQCRSEWKIYDLALYTSASKAKGAEFYTHVLISPEAARPIFIGYEYGETDADDEFDRNDITWCSVFTRNGEAIEKIFDDETA